MNDRKLNSKLKPLARNLRKQMTKEERHLWYDFLKDYPIKFYRQRVIGKYIADFYCAKAKLVVELDGSTHYSETNIVKDQERTTYLQEFGLQVIRIPNNYFNKNFLGACEYIDEAVKSRMLELSIKS